MDMFAIEKRLRSMKTIANMLLNEATIIEKELGLATDSAPRKGLTDKQKEAIKAKSDKALIKRITKRNIC